MRGVTWISAVSMLVLALVVTACGQLSGRQTAPEAEGAVLRSDFTEETWSASQTDYAIVVFRSPPAASYEGGIPGLERTKPEPGRRFDESSPAVQAYLRHLEHEHANFRSFLQRGFPQVEVVREYFIALNAVAVELNGASPDALQRGPGVRAAHYSTVHRPTLNRSVEIVSAPEFWTDAGTKGGGVRVAVIDSGIDFTNPLFACKTPSEQKVYASGVAFFDPDRVLISDHGTHVAGIVAGCEGTSGPAGTVLAGVAPEAEVHAYNVFPGFGASFVAFGVSGFSHDIAAAIDDAVRDGMHVINMSLGGPVDGPHDFLAEAANAAVDAGVVVVTSAGNAGPAPYTVGSPATAEKAISVAATTNSHTLVVPVQLDYDGDGAIDDEFGGARGQFDPFAAQPATARPLALAERYGDALACSELSDDLPDGSVVLILRGACTFTTKVANAAAAGAFGAVIYNHTAGEGAIAMAGEGEIPAIGISLEAGEAILDDHDPSLTLITIDGNTLAEVDAVPDLLPAFSSRGPAPFTGIIKPEIAAPGVNVLSSVFGESFALFAGTSMASPHVAGAAALLLAANPDWSPAQVKAALVNGAEPLVNPETGRDYGWFEIGNGRLDVAAAGDLEFLVVPPVASFGFHNRGGRSPVRSVELTVEALDGNASCSVAEVNGGASVDLSSFDASPTATVTLSLDDPNRRSGDEEGSVTFACDGQSVRVPWASYEGPAAR